MAEQDSKNVMIQLPWTVPQQPNVQTIVLQQPAQTHMELNASTDKTAISSFALSVVIALALGGLATWLAYWYGRKSFDLTKQSFDAVIAQIQSSEQVSLNLNEKIFEQQKELQKEALLFKKKETWKREVRIVSAEYMMLITELIHEITVFQFKYLNDSAIYQRENAEYKSGQLLQKIVELHSKAFLVFCKLDQFFSTQDTNAEYLVDLGDTFNELCFVQLDELRNKFETAKLSQLPDGLNVLNKVNYLFTNTELDEYKSQTIVRVLSDLMRKINFKSKELFNESGAD